MNVRDVEKANLFWKIIWFIKFTFIFWYQIIKIKPSTILIYDSMPILSYRLISSFIIKPETLWYHNHDVVEDKYCRKWSLIWWAWKSEKWIFPKLNIFSLPSIERKKCFSFNLFNGKFFFLPNYPSRKIYTKFRKEKEMMRDDTIKILYQGSIGELHGLEEIISLLNIKVQGKSLKLILKGFINDEYLINLKELASQNGVEDKLIYIGPTGYNEVIKNASECHIGIGIHKKNDIMNNTLGTASNKIYEYIALGMPVILYENEHFKDILKDNEWAFFTDTSKKSLLESITKIIDNYSFLSNKAVFDFNSKLCFESHFSEIISYFRNQPR